jgi:hypothetical protein
MLARMVLVYVGTPIALVGLMMLIRGWIYTLKPNGKMAEKRKRRNLKVGFTTDMKLFGRKVRRLGLILVIVGAAMVGWHLSQEPEIASPEIAPAAPAAAP